MTLHKALKVKNRLIGEINRNRDILRRENSRRDDNLSTVDPKVVETNIEDLEDRFLVLKGEIAKATAPISDQLVQLAYLKDKINFFNSLPTRKGEELVNSGLGVAPKAYMWSAHLDREAIDAKVKEYQDKINKLQDFIDEFNAKAQISFSE